MRMLQKINKTQHPDFARWILSNISGNVLDLGCGDKWYHPFIQGHITSVDIFERSAPDYLLDIGKEKLPFANGAFDFVLLFDVLEHIDKAGGRFALKEAKRVACGQVLVLTPAVWDANTVSVFSPGSFYYHNKNNLHKCLYRHPEFVKHFGFSRVEEVFAPQEYCFYRWSKVNA